MRVGSWFCVILLAFLSLLPSNLELRTGAPGELEHLIAYFVAAVLFGLSYPPKRILVAVTLVVIAGFLEALQVFSPGRTARFLDLGVSGAGAVLGLMTLSVIAPRDIRLGRKRG
jgi:VanZ family protein